MNILGFLFCRCVHCDHQTEEVLPITDCVRRSKTIKRMLWECCKCGRRRVACNYRGEPLVSLLDSGVPL